MEQRSPEWFATRLGKVTGSRVADVMARTKTGFSASRANYAAQLANERVNGKPCEDIPVTAAMLAGIENEPIARSEYETITCNLVDEIAFVDHPTIPMAGASPDGLVGDDGLVEIKSPQIKAHTEYLMAKAPPQKYYIQMQWQMACTGRKWCDFLSFNPDMADGLQTLIIRVPRDNDYIAAMESEVTKFLAEVDRISNELHAMKGKTIFLENK